MFALSAMLEDGNVNKCIIMGITVLNIVIWGGKLLVLLPLIDLTAPLLRCNRKKLAAI